MSAHNTAEHSLAELGATEKEEAGPQPGPVHLGEEGRRGLAA